MTQAEISAQVGVQVATAMTTTLVPIIKGKLNEKQDAEDGKGLSTEDYTTAEKNKLAGIASGAEVNIIDSITVNSTAATVSNKTVALTIPTKVSDISNDSGFQTAEQVEASIDAKVSGVYRASESATLATLPALTKANLGRVSNMTESFTTTADFVEGAGITFPLGTNVVIVEALGGGYKYDVLAGFVDLSGKQGKLTVTGAANKGVYVSASGVVSAMTYEVNANVPANFAAASVAPLMDGTAVVGLSMKYAREDHVHPSDTNKVDKVTGKGLSTNDYTTAEKNKLAGIPSDANHTTIDSTLSNSGQAADAKTVGDLFHRMALYFDASGNPVTFSDAKAANIQALSVTLTPTQSGSGTPSPTNIRPISGVSSVRVTCHNAPSGTLTITPAQSGSGTPSPSNVRLITPGLSFVRDDNSTLTVYGGTLDVTTGTLTVTRSLLTFTDGTGWRVSTADNGESFLECPFASNNDQPETMARSNLIVVSSHYPTVSTLASGKRYGVSGYRRYAYFFTGDETPNLESFKNWLIARNAAGTPFQMLYTRYQPAIYQLTPTETERALAALGYAGNAIVVPLVDSNSDPLTVYGGTLDVTTGTLSVTHSLVRITGQGTTWYKMMASETVFRYFRTSADYSFLPMPANDSVLPDIVANMYLPATLNQLYDLLKDNGIALKTGYVYIRDTSKGNMTIEEFAAEIDAHPVEILYPLASPVTYQLTPRQLATLAGYNAVSTSAGTLNVTYKADTSLVLGGVT